MSFDLCTIDWTAIGSIVTFVAMIIAYLTIHISDKQNKSNQQLQLLLVQRDIEQKRLDELIENIMIINDSMQPIIVADYSVKLTNGIFTEDDRHFIDEMAANDDLNNNRLNTQLIKYDKNESAKNVLIALSNLRLKYGEWVRNLSSLNAYKEYNMYLKSDLSRIIDIMINTSKEIAPKTEHDIHNILCSENSNLDKAMHLMNIYSHMIITYLLENKKVFEKELFAFVEKEQKRIDNMIFNDLIK